MNTEDVGGNLHPEQIRNPAVNYERRDLSARGIFIFLVALAMVIVAAALILWGMFRSFGRGNVTPQPSSAGIMTAPEALPPGGDPAQSFPAPRLQPDPVADMNKFRTQEDQILESYGWVDKDNGVVRIPIGRAMQLIEQRGLPVRVPGQPIPTAPPPAAGQPSGAPVGTAPPAK